jgi:hypothetical protein
MGIGPQGLGSMGMKSGVHACGSPLNKMSDRRKDRKKAKAVKNLKVPADSGNKGVDAYFNKAAKQVKDSALTKKDTCWEGYKAQGQKKSPSGKKTASGKPKMVNNCVKI